MIAVVCVVALAGLVAAETTGTNIVDVLLKGGPFALVLALIITDKLGTNSERDRLRSENSELRSEIAVQNTKVQDQILPSVIEMNRLMTRVISVLEDLDRARPKR